MTPKRVTAMELLANAVAALESARDDMAQILEVLPTDKGTTHPLADDVEGARMHAVRAITGLERIRTMVEGWR